VLGGNWNLTTRDYARIGQMFSQNGRYNGQQIVPAEMGRRPLTPRFGPDGRGQISYGYQWWIHPECDRG